MPDLRSGIVSMQLSVLGCYAATYQRRTWAPTTGFHGISGTSPFVGYNFSLGKEHYLVFINLLCFLSFSFLNFDLFLVIFVGVVYMERFCQAILLLFRMYSQLLPGFSLSFFTLSHIFFQVWKSFGHDTNVYDVQNKIKFLPTWKRKICSCHHNKQTALIYHAILFFFLTPIFLMNDIMQT